MGWSMDSTLVDTTLFCLGFLSFTIFRIFDILKIGPVKGMDDIKSGTGIMMDDVVAGIFALLITQSLVYFTE